MKLLHRRRHRYDFLDELAAQQRRDESRSRSGAKNAVAAGAKPALRFHAVEKIEHGLGLSRAVTPIIPPDNLVVSDENRLDGRRADIDAGDLHDARSRASCDTRFAPTPIQPCRGTR